MNLVELQEKGVELYLVEDNAIRYRGPEGVLTASYVEEIRRHKADLLRQLTREDNLFRLPLGDSIPALLAWALELSEQDLVLSDPASYAEAPQRTVTTGRVSWYAAHYLKTIVLARHHQQHPGLCWGQWTPSWWHEREMEAVSALTALREAIQGLLRENQQDMQGRGVGLG